MANSRQAAVSGPRGDAEAARDALVRAGAALLPYRAPSSVSGRELAAAAGVNYGLVHHYFGGKDAVLRAALVRLRDEFLERHPDPGRLPMMFEAGDPYLCALGRIQADDPGEIGRLDEHPVAESVLAGLATRAPDLHEPERQARAIALLALQLAYGLFQDMLLEATGVSGRQRAPVEAALGRLYDDIALFDPTDHREDRS